MSSMRLLSKLIQSEAGHLVGSHCLVEWEEEGNLKSVVDRKRVMNLSRLGEVCEVKVTEKNKAVVYNAKILACGAKRDMDQMLDSIDHGSVQECHTPSSGAASPKPKKSRRKESGQRPKVVTKGIQKKLQERESNRVTELLLAGLSTTPVASQNSECTTTYNQDSHSQETHLEDTLQNSGDHKENTPPVSPEILGTSFTPASCRRDGTPPRKRLRTDLAGRQETCQMVNTHDDEYFSFCRSPSPNLRPANQSTPANQPLPSTPPYITSLKEWMTAQFEELHGKIDACATAIEELRTVVTKKKAKKPQHRSDNTEEERGLKEGESVCQDPLTVCCGQVGASGKHVYLRVPTEAALMEFQQVSLCPPNDPAKFALKLLSVFFTDELLSTSNCTKAEGRSLLDQEILLGIKHHTNFKFPVPAAEEAKRWQNIVIKNLNTKCRSTRRKLKTKTEAQEDEPSLS